MKFRRLAIFSLISLLGAGLGLVVAYSGRTEQVIAVGELGDAPFVSGFGNDEAGAPRYRWTVSNRLSNGEAVGLINFPVKAVGKATLQLELGAANGKPFEARVLVNGVEVGRAATIAGEVRPFRFEVSPEVTAKDFLKVEIRSPAFVPGNGDSRSLGLKVQSVRLTSSPGLRLPPLDMWLWATLEVLAVGAVVFRRNGRMFISAGFGLASLIPWLILPYLLPRNLNLWYRPYLLPLAGGLALLLALVVWREETTLALWRFPARLEKGKLAQYILLVASLLYLLYAFAIIVQMDYIGHADYADNGVVARNLVQGRGLSADYAAQFYLKYPGLPRPADTWPPLQPLLIAPFFVVLGATAFAAKLPNLLLMLCLTWAIFYYGARLFNRRTALGAALLCLGAPAFFETVAYPINDLSFTLFSWLALATLYRVATFRPMLGGASAADTDPEKGQTGKTPAENNKAVTSSRASVVLQLKNLVTHPLQRPWLRVGLWAGLLFLSKPSGGIILAAAAVWLLFQKFYNKALRIEWRGLLLGGGVALLLISPWLGRNLLEFGTPIYSTEQRDVWLLKYYPPDERIYDLYYLNPARALPVPNKLLEYGFDTIFKAIGNQFTKEWNDLLSGNFLAPLLWLLVGLGLMVLPRRRAGLVGLIGFAFVIYLLFINIYWHYEIRYFMAWLPWCYAFGLYGLTWVYDKMAAEPNSPEKEKEPGQPNKGRLAAWVLAAVFAGLWLPGVQKIIEDGPGYTGATGIVQAANWLKQNTPGEARVMSRNIWELSFHSQRQGAMIPNNASLDDLKRVMRDYQIRYLELDHTNLDDKNQPDDAAWNMRRSLWPLIRKELDPNGQVAGFKKIYEDKFGFIIYELLDK